MTDEFSRLRSQAADAVRAQRLPAERPQRVLAGPGLGETCAVCNGIVSPDQFGLEFDYASAPDSDRATARLHVHCYRAWEQASGGAEATDSAGTPRAGIADAVS